MKRQSSEWEKIITNEKTDKDLISRVYKQLIQLNTRKKQTTQSKNGWKTFLKRRHTHGQQRDAQHCLLLEKCKSKLYYNKVYLTPVRTVIIKKSGNDIYWRGCGDKGVLLHC